MRLETFIRQSDLTENEWQAMSRAMINLETKPSGFETKISLGPETYTLIKTRYGINIDKTQRRKDAYGHKGKG